jgi:hypothetical protein
MVAEDVALRLFSRAYDELDQLADDECQADAFLMQQGFDIHRAPHVSLIIGRAGRMRKKICVEITVFGAPFNSKETPGTVYFEKFSSGKLVIYGFKA